MISKLELDPTCSFVEVPVQEEIYKIRSWGNKQESTAIALLVHGLGAHSGWFEAAAKELARRGFWVLAFDQRGFGSRESLEFNTYKQWTEDLSNLVCKLKKDYPDLPFYLMGNSMGGLVVMAACRNLEPNGIVIFSPGFDGHPKTFSLLYKFKSVLSALVSPQKPVALPYGFEIVTRVESVRHWLEADPVKRSALPGFMLFELLKLSQEVIANLKEAKVPVLMITAGQEKVVNNQVNEKLFKRLSAPSKKHVHILEAWHDLMFDPLVDEVADAIKVWQGELEKSTSATRHMSSSTT